MNKWAAWIRAVRVPTLTASVIPVALGGVLALGAGSFHLLHTALAAAAMAFFQITSNLVNDVDDFNNSVDTKGSLGSTRVIVDGLLPQRQVMGAAVIFFCLAVAIGVYLSVAGGLFVFILGAVGAGSAIFYTRKPFQFKYKGYGIPLVFLTFGPLPVVGSYYLSTSAFDYPPLVASIPVGLLTAAILHANDLRDMEHDADAGIKSLAITLGKENARRFYRLLITAPFVLVAACVFFGIFPFWSLLTLVCLPLAAVLAGRTKTPDQMKDLDHQTAALELVFGLLLLISILL